MSNKQNFFLFTKRNFKTVNLFSVHTAHTYYEFMFTAKSVSFNDFFYMHTVKHTFNEVPGTGDIASL